MHRCGLSMYDTNKTSDNLLFCVCSNVNITELVLATDVGVNSVRPKKNNYYSSEQLLFCIQIEMFILLFLYIVLNPL